MEIKELKAGEFLITGQFKLEEIKEFYEAEVERYQKSVSVPGYRIGKTPKDVIIRRFGDEIKDKSIKQKIQEILKSVDKWIRFLGIKNLVTDEKDGVVNFKAEVFAIPKLNLDIKVDVKKEKIEITEKDIEEALQNLRERYSTYEKSEEDEDGKLVDILIKDAKGKTIRNMKDALITEKDEDWLKDILKNMKPGEKKTASVIDRRFGEIKVFVHFKSKMKKLYPKDEDIAKTMGHNSIEELKEKIKEELKKIKDNEAREISFINAVLEIAKKNKIEPPRILIESELRNLIQDGVEYKTAERLAVVNSISIVVLENIANENKIEIKDEEIEQGIIELSQKAKIPPQKIKEEIKKRNIEEIMKLNLLREKAKFFLMEKLGIL